MSLRTIVHKFSQIPPYCVSLGTASENGHAQTVERLLEGGANVNYYDKVQNTICVLHCVFDFILSNYDTLWAVSYLETLQLMNAWVGVSPWIDNCYISLLYTSPLNCTQNGYTALLMSCRRGHTNVIHILLKYGADPNLTPTVDTSVCTMVYRMRIAA